jgi:hypothetical protein
MTVWEYGRLVCALVATHDGGPTTAPSHHWEARWHGPDGGDGELLPAGTGMAGVNRAGADGWELVTTSEDRQTFEDGKTLVIEVRYTFKRPAAH